MTIFLTDVLKILVLVTRSNRTDEGSIQFSVQGSYSGVMYDGRGCCYIKVLLVGLRPGRIKCAVQSS